MATSPRDPSPNGVSGTGRAWDQEAVSDVEFPPGYGVNTVPSWIVKKKLIGGIVIQPFEGAGKDAVRHFPSAGQADGFDLQVLSFGAGRAEELVRGHKSLLVFIPVYWNFIDQAKARERYLTFLATLSEPVRRLFVFELAGVPEDLMLSRVEERIRQLRPYCRTIVCRTRLARRDFSIFAKLPIHAVGIDLGELPTFERGIIPAFDAFMDAVEPTKRSVYVHGLTSKSLLIAIQSAGADFVSGPIIPKSKKAPDEIHGFEIADLYEFHRPETNGPGS